MHKNMFALTLATSVVLAACTATAPTEAAAPDAAPSGPPPGASGKLSPEMVGKVSPVPAFMGLGEHFNIQIQSEGGDSANGLRHRVHLVWGTGTREAEGTLVYRGTPGPAHGAPIALDGTLETATGKKTIRVEIVTEACTDDADVAHPQRVTVAVQGETAMRGCGELAVY
jgi:hypothetical protein